MTLVLTLLGRDRITHTSDRMVTKYYTGKDHLHLHNAEANKSIVIVCHGATLTIGFTGIAYVGLYPTDHWIARTILGRRHDEWPAGVGGGMEFGVFPKLTITKVISRLREALIDKRFPKGYLQVIVSGYSIRRNILGKFLLFLTKTEHGDVEFSGNLRPFLLSNNQCHISFAGQPPYISELHQAVIQAGAFQENMFTDICVNLTRIVASRSSSVGRAVCSVTMHHPRHKTIEVYLHRDEQSLSADHKGDFSFTPWIITPGGINPPLRFDHPISIRFGEWEIKLNGTGVKQGNGIVVSGAPKVPRRP